MVLIGGLAVADRACSSSATTGSRSTGRAASRGRRRSSAGAFAGAFAACRGAGRAASAGAGGSWPAGWAARSARCAVRRAYVRRLLPGRAAGRARAARRGAGRWSPPRRCSPSRLALWGGERPRPRRSRSSCCGSAVLALATRRLERGLLSELVGYLRRGARRAPRRSRDGPHAALRASPRAWLLWRVAAALDLGLHAPPLPRAVRRGAAAAGGDAHVRRPVAVRRLRLGLRPGQPLVSPPPSSLRPVRHVVAASCGVAADATIALLVWTPRPPRGRARAGRSPAGSPPPSRSPSRRSANPVPIALALALGAVTVAVAGDASAAAPRPPERSPHWRASGGPTSASSPPSRSSPRCSRAARGVRPLVAWPFGRNVLTSSSRANRKGGQTPLGLVVWAIGAAVVGGVVLYAPFAVAAGPGELWDSLVAAGVRDGAAWRLPFPLELRGDAAGVAAAGAGRGRQGLARVLPAADRGGRALVVAPLALRRRRDAGGARASGCSRSARSAICSRAPTSCTPSRCS